jgi:hypothetical protein
VFPISTAGSLCQSDGPGTQHQHRHGPAVARHQAQPPQLAQRNSGPDVTSADEDLAARHHEFAGSLDPVDDIVKSLMGQYGPTSHVAEYLGVADGHWMTVPVGWSSAPLAPVV